MGMADRYDGRLAVRAPSDRKSAEANQPEEGESDPLNELARAVAAQGPAEDLTYGH